MKSLFSIYEVFSEGKKKVEKKVILEDGITGPTTEYNSSWVVGSPYPNSDNGKEREDFGVIIVENQVILKTIAGKFMEN